MRYVNAYTIFPEKLIEELQRYMPSGYVSIFRHRKSNAGPGVKYLVIGKN